MQGNQLRKRYSFFGNVKSTLPDFGLGALLGILAFVLIYGVSTLNVAYDSWIYAGYIEEDIIQSYGGWLYFRHSPWSWPLTVTENLSVPLGASISFTDSIPLVAVVCKLFAPVLPSTFQYFGWYNLFNFALQGGFAMLLLRHFRLGRIYSLLGSMLFVVSPIFIERVFRHNALASQWLVLAVLWLYFKSRVPGARFPLFGFVLLCTLAVGIHFYFLPMLYAIFLAAILYQMFSKKKFWRYALYLGGSFVLVLGMAYVLGILTRGGGGSASGFGSYSMNLNALANPTSFDWYAESGFLPWSRLLPVLPQGYHQYDAFNYIGAGILLALVCMAVYGAARFVVALVKKDTAFLRRVGGTLKGHAALLLVCFCLSLFAVSNVVTLNDGTLFTVRLPEPVLVLSGIFRSSGRLFWPCNYLLVLAVVVFIGRRFAPRWRELVLLAVVLVQVFDISQVLVKKHNYFANGSVEVQNVYTSDEWKYLAESYDNFSYLGNLFDYQLTTGLIRYNPDIRTDAILTNRGEPEALRVMRLETIEFVKSGEPLPDNTVYVCSDIETFESILHAVNGQARGYQVGRFYFIANPLPGCPLREFLPAAAK